MKHNALVAVVVVLAGGTVACTVGAPPGFSSGDRWTFPLVGPLEDGLLVTPVSVHGHGPYLFAIDPDANVTAVDKEIVDTAGLRMGSGPHRIDENDTGQIRLYAELLELKVANLTIDRRDAMVFPNGLYDTAGRHINGILGRDVIADSLVFGFDRDQGIAILSTTKAFQPPPDAIAIKYQNVSSKSSAGLEPKIDFAPARAPQEATLPVAPLGDVTPVPRRLASVQIGGAKFAMHLDLGAPVSQLRESGWGKANLPAMEGRMRLVDEAATVREVTRAGLANDVALGGSHGANVTFVPFVDKRWPPQDIDGALGLDFFRPYAVYAHWDATTFYLKPRGAATATTVARLGRWGADLPACANPGCVTLALVAADGGPALKVVRDPAAAKHSLELFIAVTPAAGRVAAPLLVELPSSTSELTAPLPAEYEGATLAVLDASPFPRLCQTGGGCATLVGAPLTAGSEPPPAAPGPPPPRTVPLDKLHRLTGEAAIPPGDAVRSAAAGKPLAVAIVKVCLDADGKVESTKVVKSSTVAAYDEQLETTIKTTWTFEPVQADGKPTPACTQATFLTR